MKKLTIVASNRDRLDLKSYITKYFIKSLENQSDKDFEVLIVDGGSKNYKELKRYFASREVEPLIRIIKCPLGEKFERAKLNNVGIRNANTPYIMTTDVDMFFGKSFVEILLSHTSPDRFIESRTMYWKPNMTKQIYKGRVDPFNNIEECKHGRLKKRTSAGGCQCTSIENWSKLRGFNEDFVGWGSEDVELLKRAIDMRLKIKWLGESIESINLFHQHHEKIDINDDLKCQEINKKIYQKSKQKDINVSGWGGIYDL